ncbi:MAG: hypothetical protein ACRDLB_14530 [Actinomycetota bacterium]
MRTRSLGAAALLLLTVAALPARAALESAPSDNRIDDANECLDAAPTDVSVTGVSDDGHEVMLDMLVLLDDLTTERGMEIVARMQDAYAAVGAKLNARYEEVSFPADGQSEPDADGISTPFIYTDKLFQLMKDHVGGYRPYGTDVVYTVTAKELMSTGALGGSVAGQADCIGGIRYPDAAFAIGESMRADWEEPGSSGNIGPFYASFTAKVASHEVAHLLGAHHHYANCAEGEKEALTRTEMTPCTMMFNDVGLISLHFGTLEAAVVRGHLLAYADDTPAGEMPITDREVSLRLKRIGAKGTVGSIQSVCTDGVAVELQRKSRATWQTIAGGVSEVNGNFSFDADLKKGIYRASLPETVRHGTDGWTRCGEITSPKVRRR